MRPPGERCRKSPFDPPPPSFWLRSLPRLIHAIDTVRAMSNNPFAYFQAHPSVSQASPGQSHAGQPPQQGQQQQQSQQSAVHHYAAQNPSQYQPAASEIHVAPYNSGPVPGPSGPQGVGLGGAGGDADHPLANAFGDHGQIGGNGGLSPDSNGGADGDDAPDPKKKVRPDSLSRRVCRRGAMLMFVCLFCLPRAAVLATKSGSSLKVRSIAIEPVRTLWLTGARYFGLRQAIVRLRNAASATGRRSIPRHSVCAPTPRPVRKSRKTPR